MVSLLLTMVSGGFAGFLLKRYRMVFLSIIMQIVICLILFFLGLELSSDRALFNKIGTLGMQAGAITIGALTGSLFMADRIYRLFFKKLEKKTISIPAQTGGWKVTKESIAIFISFFTGILCGFFNLFTVSGFTAFLLYVLLFLVGIGVGKEATLFATMRQQGFRFLLLPLGTLTGTLAGVTFIGCILPGISILDSLAVGSGMGYYSLSSVLLSHSRGAELGSVALMSNILRELITLFFAPWLVRLFGKLAPISAGGVTSMDVTLPVIIRCSGKEYAALAVIHGAILDPLVPVLVGVFGGWS